MASASKAGKLFIISGASGTGKTTLCRQLEKEFGIFFSISATTRHKRPGEQHGKDYFFLSREEFEKQKASGQFLESALVHENYYGTPKEPIESRLHRGQDVLLDIDTQGALQLKHEMPEAISIFLKTPTLEELERRLKNRATDSEEAIAKRLKRAEDELKQSGLYDYVVVNEDLKKAKEELIKIIERSPK